MAPKQPTRRSPKSEGKVVSSKEALQQLGSLDLPLRQQGLLLAAAEELVTTVFRSPKEKK